MARLHNEAYTVSFGDRKKLQEYWRTTSIPYTGRLHWIHLMQIVSIIEKDPKVEDVIIGKDHCKIVGKGGSEDSDGHISITGKPKVEAVGEAIITFINSRR